MKVINTEKKPIKLWLEDIEDGALEQAKNLANLPFIFKHIAIMPDSHQGYGMPIGAVMATQGVVVPNAVGVDIGCGMCAVKTSLTDISTDTLKKIMGEIRKVVPVGFNKHKEEQDNKLMPKFEENLEDWSNRLDYPIVDNEYNNALKSIGTLGGGNHFIEIQKGNDGYIWIMIHSGSRNLGFTVAERYNKLAIELNEKWYSGITTDKQLAFLPLDSEEGQSYLKEMNYCIDFAFANRKLMMNRVIGCMRSVLETGSSFTFNTEEMINKVHNSATMENHFGKNVMVHRKGATIAHEGELGMIPGSQGTKSYIVKGKGNADSFGSCSHGAGRKMGRKQAERELDLDSEIKHLNDMGVIHSIRNVKDLDEAPSAYKDIDVVMSNQTDLVDIVVELTPLAVVKG